MGEEVRPRPGPNNNNIDNRQEAHELKITQHRDISTTTHR